MATNTWKELKYLLDQRQKGYNVDDKLSDYGIITNPTAEQQKQIDMTAAKSQYALQNFNTPDVINSLKYQDVESTSNLIDSGIPAAMGYGDSKYDYGVDFRDWVKSPTDYRANGQSGATQFFNGLAKLVPYAATTFLDNTAGLVSAVTNTILPYDVPLLSTSENRSFIQSPFAETMQRVRDWSEEVFPNFRTEQEMQEQDQWWKHLNANFWGDTFIKNLGFTIGAAFGGKVFGKGAQALRGKAINEAYKAGVAAAVKGDAAAQEAFQKVLQGSKFYNPKKVYDTFAQVKRKVGKIDAISALVGGIGGAVGESRTEAITAAKEFKDEFYADATNKYKTDIATIEESLLKNPDYVTMYPVTDVAGNVLDWKPTLNQAGLQARTAAIKNRTDAYNAEVAEIEKQATSLANTTFALNMPLLTAGNIIMFGKFFSGGYKTQSGNFLKRLSDGTYAPLHTSKAGAIAKGTAVGVKNALVEGNEEISQKIFSETAKDIAKQNMAAFNNASYDKDAIKDVSSWLLSMANSAMNVYGDNTSWEEFAVGALTGAIGFPMKGGWSGGIAGGYIDVLSPFKKEREYANKLNKLSQNPEFKARWEGLVRHVYYDKRKDADLQKNDSFAWHNDNDSQLISDVMAFANAGRLNDLEDMVGSFADIKLEDIPQIRSLISDETDTEFANRSDEYIQNWVKKRADDVKKTINQYRNAYDALNFLAFGTTKEKTLNEYIYTQAQMQNFEDRYIRLSDKVIAQIKPTLEQVAQEKTKDGSPTKRAEVAQQLLSSEDNLRRLFGGVALDAHAREKTMQGMISTMLDETRKKQVLQQLEGWGAFAKDPKLKDQVSDLQKLINSRQIFYAKLFDPKFRDEFNNQAKTAESTAAELEDDVVQQKANEIYSKLASAKNLKEYVQLYNQYIPNVDKETLEKLDPLVNGNDALVQYENTITAAVNFSKSIAKAIDDATQKITDTEELEPYGELADILNNLREDNIVADAEGEDHEVAVANDILSKLKPGSKAEKIAKDIFEQVLKDKAASLKYGTVPASTGSKEDDGSSDSGDTGDSNSKSSGGSDAGKQKGSQNPDDGKTPFMQCIEYVEGVTDLNDSLLEKWVNGNFEGYDELDEDEKASLAMLAEEKLQELREAAGLIAQNTDGTGIEELGSEESTNTVQSNAAHKEFVAMDTQSVRGSIASVLNQIELRKGRVKIFMAQNPGVRATVNWKLKHHVQEFIDSGALAALSRKYESKGEKLPIFFLGNPHYLDNNLDNNPFVVSYPEHPEYQNVSANVVLAIEMTDENRRALSNYEQAGIFSEDTLIEIDGKKYQVIGELWNPSPKDIANKPESEREGYERVKAESNRIWNYAMKYSILPQYGSDRKKVGEGGFPKEGKWYVAKTHPAEDIEQSETHEADYSTGERLYTTLNYIMSGRNETREIGSDEYVRRPLYDTMTEYVRLNGFNEASVAFAIMTKDGIIQKTEYAPDFPSSIKAPAGSLWIATKEANGNWAWNYVTIATTNEIDLANFMQTSLGAQMPQQLDAIFQPVSDDFDTRGKQFTARVHNAHELSEMFYLGQKNVIHFSMENGKPVLYVGGAICYNKDEVLNALTAGKYRFQISVKDIAAGVNSFRSIVNSGILSSEMRSFVRRGASIGVNFLVDTDASGHYVTPRPVGISTQIARTPGTDNTAYAVHTNDSSNIRIGNVGYSLDTDTGKVYYQGARGRRGEEVLNATTVAQVKAIDQLLRTGHVGTHFKVEQSLPKVVKLKNGKETTVQQALQNVDLYEAVIDGITVHLQKRGDAVVQLVYSDEEWSALMSVAIQDNQSRYKAPGTAQRVGLRQVADTKSLLELSAEQASDNNPESAAPESQPEVQESHSQPNAEKSSSAASGGKNKSGTRSRRSIRDNSRTVQNPTVQETEQSEEEDNSKNECD